MIYVPIHLAFLARASIVREQRVAFVKPLARLGISLNILDNFRNVQKLDIPIGPRAFLLQFQWHGLRIRVKMLIIQLVNLSGKLCSVRM
jgi:hypothetical protein